MFVIRRGTSVLAMFYPLNKRHGKKERPTSVMCSYMAREKNASFVKFRFYAGSCNCKFELQYTEYRTKFLLLNARQSLKSSLCASIYILALVSQPWNCVISLKLFFTTAGAPQMQRRNSSRVRTFCWYTTHFLHPHQNLGLYEVRRSGWPVIKNHHDWSIDIEMFSRTMSDKTSNYVASTRCHSSSHWPTLADIYQQRS